MPSLVSFRLDIISGWVQKPDMSTLGCGLAVWTTHLHNGLRTLPGLAEALQYVGFPSPGCRSRWLGMWLNGATSIKESVATVHATEISKSSTYHPFKSSSFGSKKKPKKSFFSSLYNIHPSLPLFLPPCTDPDTLGWRHTESSSIHPANTQSSCPRAHHPQR